MTENKNDSRTIKSTSGLSFHLRYIADKQALSWYNKQEFKKKECEYCGFASAEKETFHGLIKTGVSLFKGHELLVSSNHAGEYLGVNLMHMLDIIDEHNNAAIAFEGSKNAPIKKYHFSCHYISDKSQLPLVADVNKDIYKDVFHQNNLSVGILDVYGRNPICIKSSSADIISDAFHELEKHIGINYSTNEHPYINLIIWKEGDSYILAVVPRVVYKPTEYYDENNEWDIAPGALEMSGLYLITNQREFTNIKPEQLLQITDEISFSNGHILEILDDLDLSTIK